MSNFFTPLLVGTASTLYLSNYGIPDVIKGKVSNKYFTLGAALTPAAHYIVDGFFNNCHDDHHKHHQNVIYDLVEDAFYSVLGGTLLGALAHATGDFTF